MGDLMLDCSRTMLIIVDVQGNLAHLMHEKDALFNNLQILIKSAKILELPVIWVEQIPEKLGATISEVADLLTDHEPIAKTTFCCYGEPQFAAALEAGGRKQVLMAGIEAHICVYQTSMDLRERGYEVQVVTDAVSSRKLENKQVGLEKMRSAGVGLTSVEMALFELMKDAKNEHFRDVVRLVK